MDITIEAVKLFGLPAALVIFFVWQSWKREERMSASLDNVQKEFATCQKETIKGSTETGILVRGALEGVKDTLEKVDESVKNLNETVKTGLCQECRKEAESGRRH